MITTQSHFDFVNDISVYSKTAKLVAGYVKAQCPHGIHRFGKRFSAEEFVSFLENEQDENTIVVYLQSYKGLVNIQIRFMSRLRFPDAYTYFCTLYQLIQELQRAINISKPINTLL